MDPVRTLIVDDEPLARRRIDQLLAELPDFAVQGECGTGAEAVAALAGGPPVDLVFLNVQMPDLTGVQVLLQQLRGVLLPLVVFVMAYDRYTLQAFEAHAVDYLLKPLDPDRFGRCLARVRQCLRQQQVGTPPVSADIRLPAVSAGLAPPTFPAQLLVKQPGRLYFVPTAQVQYLEATGNYVTVHTGAERHVLRSTLSQLEHQLDPSLFLRIHRSPIVNTAHLRELHPWAHGEYLLTLLDGTHLTSSRSCNAGIKRFLGHFIS